MQASAGNLKRVQLELGGKGANIVFDDANIKAAVNGIAFAIFHNQGQACIAGSRLMLHENIADEFLEGFIKLATSIKLGNPLDPKTEMGPLTSKLHQRARAELLPDCAAGRRQDPDRRQGSRSRDELAQGLFRRAHCRHGAAAGPRLPGRSVRPVCLRHHIQVRRRGGPDRQLTEYGLGGGLWTTNLQRAHRMAAAMRSGMVWINCYKRVNPGSPFGGVGSSGYGREMGFEAMHDYTEAKSVWVNVDAQIPPHYPR